MGEVGSAYSLAFFLSALLGGLLVREFTLPYYLLVIGLTAASVSLAFFISLSLEEPPTAYAPAVESPLAIFRQGMAELVYQPELRRITLLSVFSTTFLGVLVALYQPFFVSFDAPPFVIGLALALGGLLAAWAQHNAYRLQEIFGERAGLVLATVLPGILYIVLALMGSLPLIFGMFVLLYASLRLKNPLFSAYQNRIISPQNRATTLSLISMFASLFAAIMGVIYGALADVSLPLTFAVMGAIIVAASLLLRVDKVAVAGKV